MAYFGRLPRVSAGEHRSTAGWGENVGFWPRFAASLIDTVINLVFVGLYGLGVFLTVFSGGVLIVFLAFVLVIWLAYGVFTLVWLSVRGQTLGKMALGIRIVRSDDGEPPGLSVVLAREAFGKFGTLSTLGLGFLSLAWDPEKQAMHDHIAHTRVVRSR